MVVEVTLLGPPRVVRDADLVTFETRKALALLALLAMSDRPRSRAALCELLYPGHDPERSRGALRRTLSTLRKGIGDEHLETSGDALALRRGADLRLDVERFHRLAGGDAPEESLIEAAALFRQDFLEGFALRDSPEFDDWQSQVAGALRSELSSVLRRVVGLLGGRGELDTALGLARRWLVLDPLHEEAHRELMRLHAMRGDRAAALEQYRACVRTLSEELGVGPLEETVELHARIRDGQFLRTEHRPLASRAARVEPRALPDALPLVGRAECLAALSRAHGAARPGGRLVVVEGEAGVGKTRLARELTRIARERGAVVLEARCHDDEAGLPYGPVVDLLRQAARTADRWQHGVPPQRLADAGRLLPELAPPARGEAEVPLEGPGAQARLLEAVLAVVGAACAGDVPGVVIVDDVHAADSATLDAVGYLGRRLRDQPLLLLLCWRTERVPPGHRLRRLAADLVRDGTASIISPGRLQETDVEELVRAAIGERATPDLVRRVHEDSEGLPLFVVEHVAGLSTGRGGTTSAEVRGLLDGRLAGMGETARQVLGAAATIGRSFDVDTLRRASGRSDEETVEAIEELVSHGLVRESTGEEADYDFSHQKVRELVYDQITLARRQLLHRRVADALAVPRASGQRAALVAQHLRLAGDRSRAAEHHVLAAEYAASLHAHTDALEHLESALALGHPELAVVHERIGDLRTTLGDYVGALASYDAAAAYCSDPAARAGVEHKLGVVHQRRGEWDRAESYLAAVLRSSPDAPPGLRARVQVDLGLTRLSNGDPQGATELAHAALALAEAALDRQAAAQAHNMLGVLARLGGEVDTAYAELTRSLELSRELGDPHAEAAALNNLALLERDSDNLTGALELTERALALCSRHGDRHREAALENNLADLHHAAGRDDRAMVHLKRAVTIFRDVGADEATRLPEIWKLVSW